MVQYSASIVQYSTAWHDMVQYIATQHGMKWSQLSLVDYSAVQSRMPSQQYSIALYNATCNVLVQQDVVRHCTVHTATQHSISIAQCKLASYNAMWQGNA